MKSRAGIVEDTADKITKKTAENTGTNKINIPVLIEESTSDSLTVTVLKVF